MSTMMFLNNEVASDDTILARPGFGYEELLELTSKLMEQNHRLHLLNEEKDKSMLRLVHDLKNPLTSIMLVVSLLKNKWSNLTLQDVMRYIGTIEENSVYMRMLVEYLLSVSQEEEQSTDSIKPEVIDIVAQVEKVVAASRLYAMSKSIAIAINSFTESFCLLLDAHAIYEVIDNLLSNAIKYSPEQMEIEIVIAAGAHSQYPEHLFDYTPEESETGFSHSIINYVRIEVIDQGPGLSDEEKKMLFAKYQTFKKKPTGNETSTGLGLYLTKHLVEAMNGKIWCESVLGKGARFVVEFPVFEAINQEL